MVNEIKGTIGHFKSWVSQNREKLWFSILINVVVLIGFLMIFRPTFETNDDMGISNMVNGAKGVHDAHLMHCNYVLGLILSGLYNITDGMPWYAVLQYIVLFIAFTSVFYVLQRRMKSESALWLGLIIICFFAYEGYIKLQYTKTTGIVSAAGFFLLFYTLEQEHISKRALLASYAVICAGLLYRRDQFLAEAALMSGIAISMAVALIKEERKIVFNKIIVYAANVVILGVLILGLYAADTWAYHSPEWKAYREYDKARTELMDYGFPSYSENEDKYQSLGIDHIALDMYRGWNQMDTEKFSTEIMQEIITWKRQKPLNLKLLKSFLHKFPMGFTKVFSFYCFCLIGIYWLIWGKHSWQEWISLLYEGFMVGILYFYLYYRGRYLFNRVDAGLWFAAVLVVMWMFPKGKKLFTDRMGLALLLSVICISQNTQRGLWRVNTGDRLADMRKERAVFEEIHQDQEHLYLSKMGTVSFSAAYGVFDSIPFGIGQNIFPLGGWSAMSPVYFEAPKKYGVTNPYRDMIGNNKVYLIDNKVESTLEYIREWYDEGAEAVEVKQIGDYKVYQIQ